ncbi:hypothetical protein M0804_003685 [Polistes exclamans]|nr:hypothetical protein M0804_003685 [Polistes exclamans]
MFTTRVVPHQEDSLCTKFSAAVTLAAAAAAVSAAAAGAAVLSKKAPNTEHRAPSTEHRAPAPEQAEEEGTNGPPKTGRESNNRFFATCVTLQDLAGLRTARR